jgi:GTP-binding protein LepA
VATDISRIRNFCIVAHIDHGKSTLADRMLEITHTVEKRDMRAQYLDRMDLERERGITIKAQAVRLFHAAQGLEAQTLANYHLARDAGLTIVPALNKIDLPAAEPDKRADELGHLLGVDPDGILRVSAKSGDGVEELLRSVIERVPHPQGDPEAPLQALIFDSAFDTYRGVITYVRVQQGVLPSFAKIKMFATKTISEAEETGVMAPEATPVDSLGPGEVGYLVTGLKDVHQAKVGDTITLAGKGGAAEPVAGYREPKPMVWSGLFPADGSDYPDFREALDKLKLSDSALAYEPETSMALGFGFRMGFLGLLHMDIVRERLEREFDLELISTAPNVEFHVFKGEVGSVVHNPAEMPPGGDYDRAEEPVVYATVITPAEYLGAVFELCQARRGEMVDMQYLTPERVEVHYVLPLAEIVFDFFDHLKSRTRGYASLDYEPWGFQESKLVRVDILLHGEPVDAFSSVVHRDKAYEYGKRMTDRLKELIPRQLFDVAVQASIGSKIIARETVKAKRKDVLAKCYGGDITRKRKLLETQKKGKERMRRVGKVDVPQDAFIQALRVDDAKAGGKK